MKKGCLFLLGLWLVLNVNAQTTLHPTVNKFNHFYSANQPDSIYLLFNAKMKEAVKLEGTKILISQLKSQLGSIVNTREVQSPAPDVMEFRIRFEKPLVDMALIIQNDSISGIWQRPMETIAGDSTSKATPDNFSVKNSHGNLYGTLTLPEVKEKVPVVLMISGSGPTDRNMNQGQALKTNSFLMLAEALAENGIASVRYDKRGLGKSVDAIGPSTIVFDDFIEDARLFISKLQSDSRFSSVIVLGHSEGSIIGLAASLQVMPSAFISLSGPANSLLEVIRVQLKENIAAENLEIANEVIDSLIAGQTVHQKLPLELSQLFQPSVQPYLISSSKYKPSTIISKLDMPVLIVGGDTDIQVSTHEANLLAKSATKATIRVIHQMNHVLKRAPLDRKQNLESYNNPDLPLHPKLVPILVEFIKSK